MEKYEKIKKYKKKIKNINKEYEKLYEPDKDDVQKYSQGFEPYVKYIHREDEFPSNEPASQTPTPCRTISF